MRKITLLLTLLLVFGYSGYAQVSAYSFAQSAGNYTPITGGTVYLTGTFDDGISQGVTIPSFNYNGVAYTTLKINANGHIAFGTYTSTTNYSPLSSSTNANGGIVAALGRDLNSAESGTPEIRYELIGNEFVIQYKDVRRYGVSAEVLNFQIRLNTTNNVVSIVYGGTITPGLNTSYPEIGLKGATNNFLTNINNRTIGAAGGSWLNSLPGTSNASTMYFNSANVTTVPAVGTTFTFTPPVPCSGTPVAGSVAPAVQNICTGSTPTQLVGTGYSSGVSGLTFQWEESNDDGATDAWANAVGGTGATTANYAPPVFAGTPINYRLNVTCTNSTTSAQTTSVLVSTPSAPVTQASAVIAPIATINYAQAIVNWTNGSGARRVVYISDSATFADPVNNNAAALTSNTVFTGSGQQIIFDGTGASVTVTGLATDTQYYIKVYEYLRCGSGPYDYYYNVTTGTNTGTFTTCGVLTVPTLEDFTTYLPGCWQEADNGDLTAGPATFGTGAWVADGFGNVTAVGAIKINIDATGDNDWILSPLYTVPATGYELKFDAAATQWNSTNAPGAAWEADDFVEVLVSTGTTNWTVLYTFNDTNVPSNTGTPTIIDLDAYAGMDVRFAFRVVEGATNGAADIDFSVDNFEIRLTPACVEPTTLAAANITATSVDLSWIDPSGTQYDFEYAIQAAGTGVPAGAGTAIDAASVTGATLDVSGNALTANTPYEVYVRADCGGSFSAWVGPINFRTLCTAFIAPFNESFATNVLPSCWSQGGANPWEYGSAVTTPTGFAAYGAANVPDHTGTGGTFIGMDGSDNGDADVSTLLTPMIDVSGLTVPQLSYLVFSNNTNDAAQNKLEVEVYDGAAWNLVETIQANLGSNWIEYTFNITTLTITGDIQVRFTVTGIANGASSFYNDILIDDVSVVEMPTCLAPSTLATANITATSVDLSWVDPSGTQYDFEYAIQAAGTGVPAGAGAVVSAISVTGATLDVSGAPLTSATSYEFYVRANCGAGGFSTWVGPINFSTPCYPYTIPYFEGFESGYTQDVSISGCLSQESLTGTQVWSANTSLTTYNRAPRTGSWNAYIQYGNDDWIFIPIDLIGGTSYTVDLYARQDDAIAANSHMLISYGTVGTAAGMTTPITPSTGIINGSYQQISGAFTPATSGTYYVGIKGDMNLLPWYISLDDISIDVTPACPVPTSVMASNVTSVAADLSWAVTTGNYEYVLDMVATDPAGAGTALAVETYSASSLTPSTTYYFHVRSDCGSAWNTISFTTLATPPVNNDCANATVLTPGGVFATNAVVGTNDAATNSGETAPGCASYAGGDVWYQVTVPASGNLTFEVNTNTGGITDGAGAVYSGTCGSLVLIDCDDSSSSDVNDQPLISVTGQTPGNVLYFRVWEYGNENLGTFLVSAYDASLSSSSFDSNAFLAYPNPVKDVLNLEYNSEISSVRVINLLGQEVISRNINANATQVDMSQLSAGAYIVNVIVGDAVKTIKVVKQ